MASGAELSPWPNEVHYHVRERRRLHDWWSLSATAHPDRHRDLFPHEHCLKAATKCARCQRTREALGMPWEIAKECDLTRLPEGPLPGYRCRKADPFSLFSPRPARWREERYWPITLAVTKRCSASWR